eukprot:TRINITY_DN649_c0_g1_i1.p1 TRINITY_DN649_c0_g1~~TRINITY_DN649_c0_g1_i1.p1  ORF type:complete len:616 (+),score=146.14 TRINITY_DN649_c0_g1_i1:224-2071(+)
MGKTFAGEILSWEEIQEVKEYIKEHGIAQFIHKYNAFKSIKNDPMLWGDEMEYTLVHINHEQQRARLNLIGPELLEVLENQEAQAQAAGKRFLMHWDPEYASYMIEGTSDLPYSAGVKGLLEAEQCMIVRRAKLHSTSPSNTIPITMTAFPLMGVEDFLEPAVTSHSNKLTLSDSIPDALVTAKNRYIAFTQAITDRSGVRPKLSFPVFKDTNTKEESINLDCVAFGLGVCCLQITMQASDLEDARILYDQFVALAPVMLSLSSCTAIIKGHLVDTDARWTMLTSCADDRTHEERNVPLPEGSPTNSKPCTNYKVIYGKETDGLVTHIPKGRWNSVSWYLHSDRNVNKLEYNDSPLVIDTRIKDLLLKSGQIDDVMATHISHLFIRDPLIAYKDHIEVDDTQFDDHFENIQSSNWQTVRFKPPPVQAPGSPYIGWRVEFRPLEIQLTDEENAALSAVVVLIARAIRHFGLRFYIPISKVDENMKYAEKRDAVRQERFWWRNNIMGEKKEGEEEWRQMSVDEIMNGNKDKGVKGLMDYVEEYLDQEEGEMADKKRVKEYIQIVRKRASGEYMTNARWIRDFVMRHEDYKHDSVVSPKIAYDMMMKCDSMASPAGCF